MLKIQELLHICSESHKADEEEGGKEGEGEGGKSAEAESKSGGRGRDAKDRGEGECLVGSVSVSAVDCRRERGARLTGRAWQPPGHRCAGDCSHCNGRGHWSRDGPPNLQPAGV